MTSSPITVQGTLQPDGVTLQLDKQASILPGRVTVTVQSLAARSGPTMLEVLDRIHEAQRKRGKQAPTEEELKAEVEHLRSDEKAYEERWRGIWSETERGMNVGDWDRP